MEIYKSGGKNNCCLYWQEKPNLLSNQPALMVALRDNIIIYLGFTLLETFYLTTYLHFCGQNIIS